MGSIENAEIPVENWLNALSLELRIFQLKKHSHLVNWIQHKKEQAQIINVIKYMVCSQNMRIFKKNTL